MNKVYYDENNKYLGYEHIGYIFKMLIIIYPVIYLMIQLLILYLIGEFLLENTFKNYYKLFNPFEFIASILTGFIFYNLLKKYYLISQEIIVINKYNVDLIKNLLKENEELKVTNKEMTELLKRIATFTETEKKTF